MKRLIGLIIAVLMLFGCKEENSQLSAVIDLRSQLQQSNGCSFTAKVTADYGSDTYEFILDCKMNQGGDFAFTVTNPDSISGISGQIDGQGGRLTFDDQMLAFDTLADGQISPVSAPWVMIKTLLGGYISAAGKDGDDIHAVMNDSYREQTLELDIWFDASISPKYCEILWQGRRVLSLIVENFVIM